MKKAFFIVIAVLIVNQIFAYSIMDRISGNLVQNVDARSAAMGGAGVADGSTIFNSRLNPASLGFLDFNFGGQFTAGILKNDDNRSIPMYNFFDGYIDDATYVSNVNYYDQYSAAVYYAADFDDFRVSGALSYAPYTNFDCYYEEEVRNDEGSDNDNYPPIIAKNYIDGSGSISSIALTAAFTYRSFIGVGIEAAKLTGDQKLNEEIIWSEYANETVNELPELKEKFSREFDEMGLKLGLNARVSPRILLGISYTPKVEFKQDTKFTMIDTTVSISSKMKVPANFRFGASYRPQNIMRTTFNADVKVTNWQDVSDLYDSAIEYFVGVEHLLENKMPLRFGFRYNVDFRTVHEDDFAYSDKVVGPTFSAGTGFVFMNKFHIDISGEYTYRKFEALDLFMDSYYDQPGLWNDIVPADRGWENPDQVSESFFNVLTSITYKW
ncbi:OmpP1/FadL family transporter [Candidatus Cloacimonadota bacterium]